MTRKHQPGVLCGNCGRYGDGWVNYRCDDAAALCVRCNDAARAWSAAIWVGAGHPWAADRGPVPVTPPRGWERAYPPPAAGVIRGA